MDPRLKNPPRINVPHPHVRVEKDILNGTPHIAGSRVPVRRLWAWHRGGTTVESLFRRYPNLGQAKILDALAFAYDNVELIQWDLEREQALFEQGIKEVPDEQVRLPFNKEK